MTEDKKKRNHYTLKQLMKKRGHRFEREHGTLYCWTRREEREGKKGIILSMIFYYTSFEYLNGLPAYFEN